MGRPFWTSGIQFECQQSGKCCTSRGEYGYIYLTQEDRERFAEHLKISLDEFLDTYCKVTDGFVHLRDPEKDCEFLDGVRCGVYEARPMQCRTWPFWPENLNARTWKDEVATFCPGIGKGKLYSAEEIRAIKNETKEVEFLLEPPPQIPIPPRKANK